MKQSITRGQLEELKEDQIAKHFGVDKLEIYRKTYVDEVANYVRNEHLRARAREITIGNMIAILGNKLFFIQCTEHNSLGMAEHFINNGICYSVEIMISDDDTIGFMRNELCDALWEAVKQVLQK